MTTGFVKTPNTGLYRRPSDNAYRLVVVVGGKRHKLVVKNHTEKSALTILVEWREKLQGNVSGQTLRTLYDLYFSHKLPVLSDTTSRNYIANWSKWIEPRFGSLDLKIPTYSDFQLFANDLLKAGLSPKTCKNIISFCFSLYQFGIRLGYIDRNPVLGVQLPRYDNQKHITMNDKEYNAFYSAIDEQVDPFWRAFWLFMLHGRRLNEVLSISWHFIDLDTGKYSIPCRINKAKRNMEYVAQSVLIDALKAIKPANATDDDLIFPSPVTNNKLKDVRKSWTRVRQLWAIKMGVSVDNLKYITIHDIRHLIGDYSINVLHLPLEQVSHTLGHSDLQITQRYVNRRPESSQSVIGSMFQKLGIQKGVQ
ncbi:hypothetical protein AGMMS50229_06970 [Campylobacterota bacterium]|nr:hypothetical protein AGMMS50229_06970 [Campylobacterota bacterium]